MRSTILSILMLSLILTGCAQTRTNSTQMNNTVEGTILNIHLQEIQSKVRGGKTRFETRFEIEIEGDGDDKETETYAGPPEMAEQFEVGLQVRITTNSSTGKHIETIEVLTDEEE